MTEGGNTFRDKIMVLLDLPDSSTDWQALAAIVGLKTALETQNTRPITCGLCSHLLSDHRDDGTCLAYTPAGTYTCTCGEESEPETPKTFQPPHTYRPAENGHCGVCGEQREACRGEENPAAPGVFRHPYSGKNSACDECGYTKEHGVHK